jgi:hypothetical protein
MGKRPEFQAGTNLFDLDRPMVFNLLTYVSPEACMGSMSVVRQEFHA